MCLSRQPEGHCGGKICKTGSHQLPWGSRSDGPLPPPPQHPSCQQRHQVAPVLVQRESHLIDTLHPALFQVRLGAQEVGVLGVVRRLLEIDIDAVCGAECRYWRENREQMLSAEETVTH